MANEAWTTSKRTAFIGRPIVTKTITAQNEWTTPSYFSTDYGVGMRPGVIALSVVNGGNAPFVASVVLQRSFDNGSTWNDVESYTVPTEKDISYTQYASKLRLGVKSGCFTSGTILVRLSQA